MRNHLLDHTLLLQLPQRMARDRSIDLHAVDEGGNGNETVRLDVLVEALDGLLVEDDGVVGLVLDCSKDQLGYPLKS